MGLLLSDVLFQIGTRVNLDYRGRGIRGVNGRGCRLGIGAGPKWNRSRSKLGLGLGDCRWFPMQNPVGLRGSEESAVAVFRESGEDALLTGTIEALPALSRIAGEVDPAVFHGENEEVLGDQGHCGGSGGQAALQELPVLGGG